MTTLAVWRPSRQWTILFQHEPYASALWALLFEPGELLMASERFGAEWPHVSAEAVIADHVVGYRTTTGLGRERLVARLDRVRGFPEAWRAFSLTRALALALAAIPAEWPLRLDASNVTLSRGSRYADLLAAAVSAATDLGNSPPNTEGDALRLLLAMAHGMNPETPLLAPLTETFSALAWPPDGVLVSYELLGKPVDCPTSHVESMTRARHQWQASW